MQKHGFILIKLKEFVLRDCSLSVIQLTELFEPQRTGLGSSRDLDLLQTKTWDSLHDCQCTRENNVNVTARKTLV